MQTWHAKRVELLLLASNTSGGMKEPDERLLGFNSWHFTVLSGDRKTVQALLARISILPLVGPGFVDQIKDNICSLHIVSANGMDEIVGKLINGFSLTEEGDEEAEVHRRRIVLDQPIH